MPASLSCAICYIVDQRHEQAVTVLDGNALCLRHLDSASVMALYGPDVRALIARTPPLPRRTRG